MKTEEKDKNIMKKVLLLLAMVCLPLFASAQTTEKQYYIYNIVTFSGSLKNEGFKVDLDDGKTIEKLKDSEGNKINPNLIPYNYFQLFLGVFIVLTNCLSAMAF